MTLEFRDGPDGERFYLGRRGIHAGDGLYLGIPRVPGVAGEDTTWVPVRFEIGHRRSSWNARYAPMVHLTLRTDGPAGTTISFELPPGAEVRWTPKG